MTLIFSCIGQSLMRSDNNLIAENSQNYLKARFDLDESWNGLAVTACFKYKSSTYHVVLKDGACTVPWEVVKAGEFRVSLFGTSGEDVNLIRATSNEVKVFVEAGPSLTGQNSAKPTPSDVEQIKDLAQSADDKADAAVTTATSVREEADSGKFNAKISSVTAESVPHGTSASVTNIGTGTDAKLVFKIPEGKQGDPGKQGPAGDSFYAFFTEDDIEKYIRENNPKTFKGLWLGETNELLEFGGVYSFTITDDGEVSVEHSGTLRGPIGPTGKAGTMCVAFSKVDEIGSYISNTTAETVSFAWLGEDGTRYSYTNRLGINTFVTLFKGDMYRFNLTKNEAGENVVDGRYLLGNLKGADGIGIKGIEKVRGTGEAGTMDTYAVYLSDDTVGGLFFVYNGKDGYNAHLTGKPIYGVYNAEDIVALFNNLEKGEYITYARNLGEAFTMYFSDGSVVTINKHGVYSVSFSNEGEVIAIMPVDSDNVEGMLVQFYDTVIDGYREVILLNGLNATQGGGAASGSGEYELIKSLTVTETEFNAGMQGLVFNLDKDNNPFSLKAVTCICEFPPASKAARLSLDMMTSETSGSTIYRRGDVLSTAETRYCRISARLEGYWIGESVHGASNSEAIVTYGTWARNKRSGKLSYIRLTSDVTLPVGTKIEVFGVRA